MTTKELIETYHLTTDGARVGSSTKSITPDANRLIEPLEPEIIKELQKQRVVVESARPDRAVTQSDL